MAFKSHYKDCELGINKYIIVKAYIYVDQLLKDLPDFDHKFFSKRGDTLIIRVGYCWDGPSGPTIDDETNIRASLVHDALYQALKERLIPYSFGNRRVSDKIFRSILKADGMGFVRRTYYFFGVRGAGALFSYF
jgi:hypothetical protein